jgi:hypothetical protein
VRVFACAGSFFESPKVLKDAPKWANARFLGMYLPVGQNCKDFVARARLIVTRVQSNIFVMVRPKTGTSVGAGLGPTYLPMHRCQGYSRKSLLLSSESIFNSRYSSRGLQ